ncbi:Hpt domain-containing protein [Vibrio sp. Vb2880]|uniref:Phosphorelay protein LuxU n=1 Tax=Vibrio furnissii TaxID=29494 RepID=A0A0Q2MC56_VIBFU|nr:MULTISPECIES: quorum-sensing phosphorelay protein LuxU [Vibrio]ADT87702.1 phosphorelay protein [Vibrio furnissii NCTC 11218]EEX42263.1 phosphorelay protein LuxU [Vibrio furnissii CIP 102972]KQH85314.1 phosphorelay protein LuxU [Vibrio furnissii]MBO0213838.1 Hpt domain-containing protein [Vibrio sp. Vb2880]MCG6211564.1 Hpt domain-containing protein [Vibrio furnissii]
MELMNLSKIDNLAQEIGEENVPVLVEIFLGELDTYRNNLSDVTFGDKLEYLKEISHALKSSAASFGADQLCAKAIDIDSRAKLGSTIDATLDTAMMIDLIQHTRQSYAQLIA